MKNLKSSFVFKLSVLLTICFYFNNIYLTCVIVIFLLFNNRKLLIYFLIIFAFHQLFITFNYDFFPYGIVEQATTKSYVINKLFYSVRLYTNSQLEIGDIVQTLDSHSNTYDVDLTKNTIYTANSFKYLTTFLPKKIIFNHINNFSDDVKTILIKQFYNQYTNNEFNFNLGYGFTIYILLNNLRKKNNKLCLLTIVLYSIFFNFQIRFILLIIDCLFYSFKNIDRLSYKLLFISFFNIEIIKNFSILIPLIYSLYYIVNLDIDHNLFLMIFSSYLFGEINLIYLFIFKYLRYIRIFYLFICLITVIYPFTQNLLLSCTIVYSKINSLLYLPLRGKLSFIGLIVYLLVLKTISVKSNKLKLLIYIFIVLTPINNPFFSVNYIDVGQGDAILIKDYLNSNNILIDTGSSYNYSKLKTFLCKNGVYRIDYLVISHNDSDHNGNIANLQNDFYIKEIIEKGKDIKLNKTILQYFYINNYDNDNDNSLVYFLDINNNTFLFTGDISENVERNLLKQYGPLSIDFLKVSHHGSDSATSDYFVSNIKCRYAIISTSGQYNHPKPSVIETLNRYGVKIISTKDSGSIAIYLSKYLNLIKCENGDVIIM